jgi:chemotaxis family two-component system sensor kinase Cph1
MSIPLKSSPSSAGEKIDAALLVGRSKKRVTQLSADLALLGYVMSHDLLLPIREMELIIQKMAPLVKEEAALAELHADSLLKIEKMFALNAAVMEFICGGNTTFKSKQIDSNEVIKTVLDDLSKQIKKSKATITHDKMPQLNGRQLQFTKLFSYLIDNAVKFRSKRPPEIHIGVKREENAWLFSVRDNGKGVAEEFLGIIFVLFQRGPNTEDIPGIGAGLTLAKKIVEYGGGEMWIESEEGIGTTVFFTVPIETVKLP